MYRGIILINYIIILTQRVPFYFNLKKIKLIQLYMMIVRKQKKITNMINEMVKKKIKHKI